MLAPVVESQEQPTGEAPLRVQVLTLHASLLALCEWQVCSGGMEGSVTSLLLPGKASPLPGLGMKKKKKKKKEGADTGAQHPPPD